MRAGPDVGGARRAGRRGWLVLGFWAALGLALAWAIASSRRADSEHRLCLDAFTALIQGLVSAGKRLEQDLFARITRAALAISVLLVLLAAAGLVWRRAKGVKPALFLLAMALATGAQCFFLRGAIPPGIGLYVIAILFTAAAELLPERFGSFAPGETSAAPGERRASPSVAEIVALAFVVSAALIYRFYALNQLPNAFDGEAAYFMACSTSLKAAAVVNAGLADGPWSPFGWLYYILVYLVTKLFGSHLLSIRFISALTGIVSIPVLWAFVRRLAGPVEALLASVFLSFALTDMFWSRTDVFPYHAPGLVAIALAWCTYEALVTERLRYFVLAALFMAVSYHQFPSGQTLFLIPLGAVAIHALLDGGYGKRCWAKALVLLVGAGLWYEGRSLNIFLATSHFQKASPFSLNAGKTLWSLPVESPGLLHRVEPIARKMGKHVIDVVHSQFVAIVPGEFPHHEAIPGLPGLRVREVSAAVAVLFALGIILLLVRPKKPASQVFLVWILAALLPGLLSTSASAHRIAAVFPAFLAAAALAGGRAVRALRTLFGRAGGVLAGAGGALLFAGLAVVAARLYLGRADASTPTTVLMSEAIHPYLTEGTLAVLDVDSGDYLSSELTYLCLDDLSRGSRPPLWRIEPGPGWPEIAFRPSPGLADWYYTVTRLAGLRDALKAGPAPKRVVFLVPDTPEKKPHAELLARLYPQVNPEWHVVSESPRRVAFVAFPVDAASLNEVTSPLVLGAVESGLAQTALEWWEGRKTRVAPAPGRGVTVSAGLWIRGLQWSRFRCPGAGEGSQIRLDGVAFGEGAPRPITRGVHRIDIRLGESPQLPLYLEQESERGPFQRFPNEDVLGPEVAARPAFAPESVVPYPGYDPPARVATLDPRFLASLAVSPSGEIGVLWAYENRWKVALYPPGGQEITWEVRRPEERSEYSRLAFAGERIALLNSPNLFLFDRAGRELFRKNLRPQIEAAHDLGANEAGELFLSATSPPGLHVLSPEGERIAVLVNPEFGPSWAPAKASVPFRGPVAVLDFAGKIHVFERTAQGQWRRTRSQPGLYSLQSQLFQIREDGWLFARVWDRQEFLVFDRALNRRVAEDLAHDLSYLDTGSQLVGFDRIGSLYFYHEGDGWVWKLDRRSGS